VVSEKKEKFMERKRKGRKRGGGKGLRDGDYLCLRACLRGWRLLPVLGVGAAPSSGMMLFIMLFIMLSPPPSIAPCVQGQAFGFVLCAAFALAHGVRWKVL